MSSVCQQDKLNIVNIKLEVGDIHEAGVLVDVQDVGVESALVDDIVIPEIVVRPDRVGGDSAALVMEPMSEPPPLCECDDFGSICQTCKIALDKITNSRSNLPPAPLPSSGDETMTQNLLSSSNFLCSECGKGFEKNWMPKRKDI